MYKPLAHHPHNLASGLASLGQNNDSSLIHMSSNGVGGLHNNMAKGGGVRRFDEGGLTDFFIGDSGDGGGGGDAAASTANDLGISAADASAILANNASMESAAAASGQLGSPGQIPSEAALPPTTGSAIAGVPSASEVAATPNLFGSSAAMMYGGQPFDPVGTTAGVDTKGMSIAAAKQGVPTELATPTLQSHLIDATTGILSDIGKLARNKTFLQSMIPLVTSMLGKGSKINAPNPSKPMYWNQTIKRVVNPNYGQPGQPYFINQMSPGYFSTNYLGSGANAPTMLSNGQGSASNPYTGLTALPTPTGFKAGGTIKAFASGGLNFQTFDPATAALAQHAASPPPDALNAYLSSLTAAPFNPNLQPFLPKSNNGSTSSTGSGTGAGAGKGTVSESASGPNAGGGSGVGIVDVGIGGGATTGGGSNAGGESNAGGGSNVGGGSNAGGNALGVSGYNFSVPSIVSGGLPTDAAGVGPSMVGQSLGTGTGLTPANTDVNPLGSSDNYGFSGGTTPIDVPGYTLNLPGGSGSSLGNTTASTAGTVLGSLVGAPLGILGSVIGGKLGSYYGGKAVPKVPKTEGTSASMPGYTMNIPTMPPAPIQTPPSPTGSVYNPDTGAPINPGDIVPRGDAPSGDAGGVEGGGGDSAMQDLGEFTDVHPNAQGGHIRAMAAGGLGSLPEATYAAGGKLLRGDGDGMSDSIPAIITGNNPQRAALADGEFVIPADVVSHLGNGSTEAGSRKLYEMMDRVRVARTGNPKQGKQIDPNKFVPA